MLVSVLVNNYNYSKYLARCIESVQNQTYKNIEIIVYDDGSTDSSIQVLDRYKQSITIITEQNYGHTPNQNQANAIYQAFLKSKGDIICLLDSDDEFLSNKIEKVVRVFEEDQKICTVQNLLQEINAEQEISDIIRPALKEIKDIKSTIYNSQSLFRLFVETSGLSFRRSFLEKVLPLHEDDYSNIWPDVRLMIQSVFHDEIVSIREPLTYYRKHGANDSNKYGDIHVYQQFTNELYSFFNSISVANGYETIEYSHTSFLENTFFFQDIDIDKCNLFLEDSQYWIWGAGEAGQSISHALVEKKMGCLGFIDSDARKQNQIVMDRKVVAPDSVEYNQNIKIIVSPYHAYDAIKNVLNLKNINEGLQFIDPYMRKD